MSDSSDDDKPHSKSSGSGHTPWKDSIPKAKSAIRSLASVIDPVPPSLANSDNPAHALVHDPDLGSQVSSLLRQPDSGAGDSQLCRWLYDTFQAGDPNLQLAVLRFLPVLAGAYLTRAASRRSLAGFEAVLLAVYAHEAGSRAGEAVTVNVPDMSHASIYHENKAPCGRTHSTGLDLAVISPTLEPHGSVRSTRRARIVGVALEVYYGKIARLPAGSKVDFCEFCVFWAGQDGDALRDEFPGGASAAAREKHAPSGSGRIALPWELQQPVLRILGHCLLGRPPPATAEEEELLESAHAACRSLHARALHDMNPKAILATRSLLRLGKMASGQNDVDSMDLKMSNKISL